MAETVLPWLGENHDELVKYRRAAMSSDPSLTMFAPTDDDPTAPYELIVRWEVTTDRAIVSEVALRSKTGAPVTNEVWRTVPVAQVVAWSRHRLGWTRQLAARQLRERDRDADAARVEQVDVSGQRKAGRPPTFGPDHWSEVAALYAATRAGGSRGSPQEVAQEMARRHAGDKDYDGITDRGDTRVKGWIDRAKTLGLLGRRTEDDGTC